MQVTFRVDGVSRKVSMGSGNGADGRNAFRDTHLKIGRKPLEIVRQREAGARKSGKYVTLEEQRCEMREQKRLEKIEQERFDKFTPNELARQRADTKRNFLAEEEEANRSKFKKIADEKERRVTKLTFKTAGGKQAVKKPRTEKKKKMGRRREKEEAKERLKMKEEARAFLCPSFFAGGFPKPKRANSK